MAVTGWKSPSTASSQTRSGSADVWATPTNVFTSNNAYAETDLGDDEYSDWLRITNFGFTTGDIPSGATIDGIEVQYECVGEDTQIKDSQLFAYRSGQVGTSQHSTSAWGTTENTQTRGGSTNLWGATWADTDIVGNANFGFELSALKDGTAGTGRFARVDHFEVRVHYTAGATTVTGSGAINGTVPTLSGTGEITKTGSGAINTIAPTLSATGEITKTGSGGVTTPLATLAGTGTAGKTGTGAISATMPTLAGSGVIEKTGTGAINAPLPSLNSVGEVEHTGTGGVSTTLPTLSGSGAVTTTVAGSGVIEIPIIAVSGAGAVPASSGGDDAPASTARRRDRLSRQDIIRLVEVVEAAKEDQPQDEPPSKTKRRIKRKIEAVATETIRDFMPWTSVGVVKEAVRRADVAKFVPLQVDAIASAQLAQAVRRYMEETAHLAREMQDAEDEELLILAA